MHNAWKVLDLKFGAMRRPLLPSSDGFKNKGTLGLFIVCLLLTLTRASSTTSLCCRRRNAFD
jgi:hypothetical protein